MPYAARAVNAPSVPSFDPLPSASRAAAARPSSGSRTGAFVAGGAGSSTGATVAESLRTDSVPESLRTDTAGSSSSSPSVRRAAPTAAALACASLPRVTAASRDARKCAAAPAARHAECDRSAPGGPTANAGAARAPGLMAVAHASAAFAAPAAHAHDIVADEVSVMESVAEGCGASASVSAFSGTLRFGFERPPASTTAARSANASAATAAAVDACSGPRVAVGSSSIGAMSGYRPSTDGVAPPAAVVADHKRSVSIQTPAASRDVSGVPVDTAARTAAAGTPSAPMRRACSDADAATRRMTRSAAAAEPRGGYEVDASAAPVPPARVSSTSSMRGHLATAVAPPAECLAAAAHSASAGATEAGCFPTSSIQRRRGRIPARNKDAIGSAARVMALVRRFSCFSSGLRLRSAGPVPSSSAWSSSSAGSGGTVPSSRSAIGPVAAVHVVGTNVASGGSPPRHAGAVAPVAATREGGAHSTQSSHHVAPLASAM